MPRTPEPKKTKHSATHRDKCYEMEARYGWKLWKIDEHRYIRPTQNYSLIDKATHGNLMLTSCFIQGSRLLPVRRLTPSN